MAKYTSSTRLKQIALFRLKNPDISYSKIASEFRVKEYTVRYAVKKYSEALLLKQNTRRGKAEIAAFDVSTKSDIERLEKQYNLCLSELENDTILPVSTRLNYLREAMKIKNQLQSLQLANHMKRADAEIIKMIVQRFIPTATEFDIITIVNEELAKLNCDKEL